MAVHITIPVPRIPVPRSRRAVILGLVAAVGVGAVFVSQLVGSEGGPSLPAASVEASGSQFLDPVEVEFIAGAGQTAVVAPMLDPVEVEFIAGAGSDAPVRGCYSVGPC